MTSLKKPILVPLPLPWKVASGCSRLLLQLHEEGSALPALLRLNAFFGPLDPSTSPPRLVNNEEQEENEEGTYADIEMEFHGVIAARFLQTHDDDEDRYDWSRIAVDYSLHDGIDGFRHRFWQTWRKHGQCPDPSAYTVAMSDWLPSVFPKANAMNHYLIVGHDNYAEIIARNYKWRCIS